MLAVFVPTVVGFAALAILVWTLGAWAVTGEPNFTRAIFAALAVFVMGYPCAMGMATPLAMIRGGGMAARQGILMRSGEAFQVLKDVKKVVLDKTGTITSGRPVVVEVVTLGGYEEEEILRLSAATESSSEHPLARAVVDAAADLGIPVPEAEDFQSVTGKGVTAGVEGHGLAIGSPRFVESEGVELRPVREELEELQEAGNTVVALAVDGEPAALIALADRIKDDAVEAVERLKAAGLDPVMLTGDNERTARAVAREVGIEEYRAEVLPQDKADVVRHFQEQGYRVLMVGDGINDAPALMQADVGIAIGVGTDIAIESADVVLVGERLGAVVDTYHIGKSSYRKTVQNISLAFAFNGIGVPLAITGLVHPIWAMIAMAASVTTVLTNSFAGQLLPKTRRDRADREGREVRLTLMVPNMRCERCVESIRDAASKLEGVESVSGDLEKHEVTVTYRKGVADPDGIREAIFERGFQTNGSGWVKEPARKERAA